MFAFKKYKVYWAVKKIALLAECSEMQEYANKLSYFLVGLFVKTCKNS